MACRASRAPPREWTPGVSCQPKLSSSRRTHLSLFLRHAMLLRDKDTVAFKKWLLPKLETM